MAGTGAADPRGGKEYLLALAALVCAGIIAAGVWLSLSYGTDQDIPGNPVVAVVELMTGTLSWSTGATVIACAYSLVVLSVAGAVVVFAARRAGRKTRIDDRAKYLGGLKDVAPLTAKGCRDAAKSMGMALTRGSTPGIPLGTHLLSGQPLYAKFEDMQIDVWGPRSGKTSSRVIPAILDAPGAVLATSNKRDLVDACRDPRSEKGRVWVFDPQQIAAEEQTWWWNPLSWVTDDERAADLADHFANGDDAASAKKDSFFDPKGFDLLATLFYAAALAGRHITDVYEWVNDETNLEPVNILFAHGKDLAARGLAGTYNQTPKQRSGVFATAEKSIRSLKMERPRPWVSSATHTRPLPQFDPSAFVRSNDTIFLLSREGNGSTAPLVTALTVAICQAAEQFATESPRGRLPVPMLAALDEAANVVKWSKLPKLYSHYGSRGILIMTILQSYAQGCQVWGKEGMGLLHSAANIKTYGGGCEVGVDDSYLRSMSEATGDHWELTGSVSSGRGGRSESTQRTKVRTFPSSDLEEWPRGRALVRSSGNRPTIVATVPWWEGPYAEAVKASIRRHDPDAMRTLEAAKTVSGVVESAVPA